MSVRVTVPANGQAAAVYMRSPPGGLGGLGES